MSRHAIARCRQRGFRHHDLETVLRFGRGTAEGTVLTSKDAQEAIAALKAEIGALERLAGTAVARGGDEVVTVYRPDRRRRRRLLRRD